MATDVKLHVVPTRNYNEIHLEKRTENIFCHVLKQKQRVGHQHDDRLELLTYNAIPYPPCLTVNIDDVL